MSTPTYLGDGLYGEDDGFQVRLFTERSEGVHEVYLDPHTLDSFFQWLERSRGIEIKITATKVSGARS